MQCNYLCFFGIACLFLSNCSANDFNSKQDLRSYSGVEEYPRELSYGSKDILERCWTKSELHGNEKIDRQVTRPAPNLNLKSPYLGRRPYLKPNRNNWYRDGSIRYVETDEKVVALTFDLCERNLETTGYDAKIINYLRKNRIKATFYAGGKWMHSHPEKTM